MGGTLWGTRIIETLGSESQKEKEDYRRIKKETKEITDHKESREPRGVEIILVYTQLQEVWRGTPGLKKRLDVSVYSFTDEVGRWSYWNVYEVLQVLSWVEVWKEERGWKTEDSDKKEVTKGV